MSRLGSVLKEKKLARFETSEAYRCRMWKRWIKGRGYPGNDPGSSLELHSPSLGTSHLTLTRVGGGGVCTDGAL